MPKKKNEDEVVDETTKTTKTTAIDEEKYHDPADGNFDDDVDLTKTSDEVPKFRELFPKGWHDVFIVKIAKNIKKSGSKCYTLWLQRPYKPGLLFKDMYYYMVDKEGNYDAEKTMTWGLPWLKRLAQVLELPTNKPGFNSSYCFGKPIKILVEHQRDGFAEVLAINETGEKISIKTGTVRRNELLEIHGLDIIMKAEVVDIQVSDENPALIEDKKAFPKLPDVEIPIENGEDPY